MKSIQGFNLVELIITTTIVIIFAAIAIPSYLDFSRRDYYSGVMNATTPYKVAVEKCYENRKTFKGCNGGTHGIPANIVAPKENVATLTVSDGVIKTIPVKGSGITEKDDYQLTPSIVKENVTWTPSGGAVDKDYTD